MPVAQQQAMEDFSPSDEMTCARIRSQKQRTQKKNVATAFERNLEDALDARRTSHSLYITIQNTWQLSNAVNFSSNDILSIGASGVLREEFLKELSSHPHFSPGSGGSRIIDGNNSYIEETEAVISAFHGAEAALILGSGYDANVAIWTAIPRLGDVILYDELVHASTHDGIHQGVAIAKREFEHNNVDSFRDALSAIGESYPLVKQGKRCVLVAVESVYSMDGDICPLQELIDCANEVFPGGLGNVQFVVDEAHGTGVLGDQGRGLVNALGLESEVAIRLHTMSKAMSSGGAAVVGSRTVRTALINFARSFIFTTAPSFQFVAAIRAGYNLLASGRTEQCQEHVQHLVRFFLQSLTSHDGWAKSQELSIFSVPLVADGRWEEQPFLTHVVPIHTPEPYFYWLLFHLTHDQFSVSPVDYPVVPKGRTRLKITFHAVNTEEEVGRLVESIFSFVKEVDGILSGKADGGPVPSAARRMYGWMKKEGLTGFGLR